MVLCEYCVINGRTSVCTLILDCVCACVCTRCKGLMHSGGVVVVLCSVCCIASGPEGVFGTTPTHSFLTPRKVPHNTDWCSKTLNICLRNRCLEVAGLGKTLISPGISQQLSPCTRRAGPRKYYILHSICL